MTLMSKTVFAQSARKPAVLRMALGLAALAGLVAAVPASAHAYGDHGDSGRNHGQFERGAGYGDGGRGYQGYHAYRPMERQGPMHWHEHQDREWRR
jgi:hypothetical protein